MRIPAIYHPSALSALAVVLIFPDLGQGATVIGNTLADRGSSDGYSGQIFLLNANLNSLSGQTVASWSFFNNNNFNAVTPVLVEDTGGGGFTVRGIGSTIVSNGSGAQGGAFNLVSGSDYIGLNYYAGYYDGSWSGSSATPNPGGVEFNSVDDASVPGQIDSTGTIWIHNTPDGLDNPANLGVGALNSRDTVYGAAVDGRHYSVNFTAAPIPEPAVTALGGITALSLLRRRR